MISASKRFGETVALIREKQGMTQADLAEKMGTKESEVEHLENGVLFFEAGYPERVARALGVPFNVIALLASDTSAMSEFEQKIADKLSELAWTLIEREEP